jgi:hypothetical protein
MPLPVKRLLPALLILSAAACYHAVIETGLTPSTQVIDKPWASGWIYGLVPPSPVATMSKCPNGVAKVETQLSFVNQLVNIITLGIYTPMAIKVTCAQRGRASITPDAQEIYVGSTATLLERQEALTRAARLSLESGAAVYVQF